MRFVFTCGGTGGHIYPAVAAAQRIRELMPDAAILFLGAAGNMELELVPREGFDIRPLRVGSLHRSLQPAEILHNLRSAAYLAGSLSAARRILRDFRPDAVLGTGGYVCYPVIRAAHSLGIPTLLHEANALPGLTTRMLEKFTDQMMVAFEESRAHYRDPDRVLFVGMPVRAVFRRADRAAARRELTPDGLPLVLSFGGSLGAQRLNEAMAGVIARNEAEGRFRLLHATGGGEEGLRAMSAGLAALGVTAPRLASLRPYLYDMPKAMAAADLIVCRAGASTLGELAAVGRPAVLVPFPHATADHQTKNARTPAAHGAAELLPDGDCSPERLYDLLSPLCASPDRLTAMGKAMSTLDRPDALDRIVAETLRLAERQAERQAERR